MTSRLLKPLQKLIGASALLIISIVAASGATFTVNQSNDSGDGACDATCTLRDAIAAANAVTSDDVINFEANIATVTLSNEIVISNRGKLNINGAGANAFAIDGGAGQNRVFYIAGAAVALTNLTLTGGNGAGASYGGNGGAIYALGGSLLLDRVHVSGNSASGGFGGAIFYFAGFANETPTNRIVNSTFSNNFSTTSCGAFENSGSTMLVLNSTLTGNTAKTGGAFCNQGSITMRNSTVGGNTASLGGGAFYQDSASVFKFGNTIIAGNFADGGAPEITFQAGAITSEGNNIVGDSAGDAANTRNPIAYQSTDILDRSPMLGALSNNGGTTPTLALLTGSPAIDAGSNNLAVDPSNNNFRLITDQRSYRRTVDGNFDGIATTDIGAYEYNSTLAASATISGRATARGRGAARVRITLRNSNNQIVAAAITNPFGYYRFLNIPVGDGYTITATSKQFTFAAQTATILGDGDGYNFAAQ